MHEHCEAGKSMKLSVQTQGSLCHNHSCETVFENDLQCESTFWGFLCNNIKNISSGCLPNTAKLCLSSAILFKEIRSSSVYTPISSPFIFPWNAIRCCIMFLTPYETDFFSILDAWTLKSWHGSQKPWGFLGPSLKRITYLKIQHLSLIGLFFHYGNKSMAAPIQGEIRHEEELKTGSTECCRKHATRQWLPLHVFKCNPHYSIGIIKNTLNKSLS